MSLVGRLSGWIVGLLTILVAVVSLAAALHGMPGNPNSSMMRQEQWTTAGPFELSSERGHYALTYSLLVDKSYHFSPELAAFVSPDAAIYQNKFVSLFPPGLSYIAMPGFKLGEKYGYAQVGTFAVISLFALLNVILINILSRRLGAHPAAGYIASLIFLVATPALAYSGTMYQHHTTSFLLMSCLIILSYPKNWLTTAIIWFFCAIAVTVDSPNFLFFAPLAVYTFMREFQIERSNKNYKLAFKPLHLITIFAALLPVLLFARFNKESYGNPYKLGGTAPRATAIQISYDQQTGVPVINEYEEEKSVNNKKSAVQFFKTRNALNGVYTIFFAIDRGIIYFTPVILLSLLGIGYVLARSKVIGMLMLSICAIVVVLYCLWGDPYGGWAFGSRYLIPAYAMLAPFLALAITRHRRHWWFILLFLIAAFYSIAINTIGAVTSNANPTRHEIISSSNPKGLPFTQGYLHNIDQLNASASKSFIYRTYLKPYIPLSYFALIVGGTVAIVILLNLVWVVAAKVEIKKEI